MLISKVMRRSSKYQYKCIRCGREIVSGQYYYNCPPAHDPAENIWCETHKPDDVDAELVVARWYLRKGDLDKGLEHVEAALQDVWQAPADCPRSLRDRWKKCLRS